MFLIILSIKIQLNSLQQQFKPHFLFNSLNSINALTISNPNEAQKMIHLLSEFMRGSIQENQKTLPQKVKSNSIKMLSEPDTLELPNTKEGSDL